MPCLVTANMRAAEDRDRLLPSPLLDQLLKALHQPGTNHAAACIPAAVAAPAAPAAVGMRGDNLTLLGAQLQQQDCMHL